MFDESPVGGVVGGPSLKPTMPVTRIDRPWPAVRVMGTCGGEFSGAESFSSVVPFGAAARPICAIPGTEVTVCPLARPVNKASVANPHSAEARLVALEPHIQFSLSRISILGPGFGQSNTARQLLIHQSGHTPKWIVGVLFLRQHVLFLDQAPIQRRQKTRNREVAPFQPFPQTRLRPLRRLAEGDTCTKGEDVACARDAGAGTGVRCQAAPGRSATGHASPGLHDVGSAARHADDRAGERGPERACGPDFGPESDPTDSRLCKERLYRGFVLCNSPGPNGGGPPRSKKGRVDVSAGARPRTQLLADRSCCLSRPRRTSPSGFGGSRTTSISQRPERTISAWAGELLSLTPRSARTRQR